MAASEITFRAMASQVQVIVVDGPARALDIARRATDELEYAWSRFIDDSDIARLNRADGQPVAVAPTTLRLVEAMRSAWTITDGRYNPTVLRSLVTAGYGTSIEDPAAATILPPPGDGGRASVTDIVVDHVGRTVTIPAGLAVDAGGVGKGLAADLIAAELIHSGSNGALVSIGGDIAAAGTPPEPAGWRVAVSDHLKRDQPQAKMFVSGGGIATSSTQTRRWRLDEHEQHHVIDPATGLPSTTDLVGATVVASCGWQAEAHATGLLLGGSTDFARYARAADIQAIATTASGDVLATDGVAPLLDRAGRS